MNFVFTLAKLLKISNKTFLKSMNTFVGLNHRYEVFLKKRNTIFINDSKATSFQATKFALLNKRNVYWILGGLPKDKDKLDLKHLKSNIVNSYIIGRNINFRIEDETSIFTAKNTKELANRILIKRGEHVITKHIKNKTIFCEDVSNSLYREYRVI